MFIYDNSRAFLNEDLAPFKLLYFWKKRCYEDAASIIFRVICQGVIMKWASHPEILLACLDLRIYGDLEKDSVSRK